MKKSASNKLRRIFKLTTIICSIFVFSIKGFAFEKPLIFPIPQTLQVTSDVFVLDESVTIIVPKNSSNEDLFLARFLVRELSDKYGIAVKIEKLSEIPDNRKIVVMGKFDNPLINRYCQENNLEINGDNPGFEGYILEVNSNIILIAGSDDSGAFFGLQSLRQLIDAKNGTNIQGVKVRDWPNLPFRAIRLYVPGPENMAFFKRFLRDFMALYKFNKVIIELKSVENVQPVHKKQLLTYPKLTGLKLGLLINFNEALLKDGITRIVNGL